MALASDTGLTALNIYIATRSYAVGFAPSQADVCVFEALSGKVPDAGKYPHAARYYNHISSYTSEERKSFSGESGRVVEEVLKCGPPPAKGAEDDDDDVDLFGSDTEEDRQREEELKKKAAAAKVKDKGVAKSMLIVDVKPWDDETDMAEMERGVRAIEMDGLLWGSSKLVPVGYGIKKLQITCVIEDDKIATDDLEEAITALTDHVQSMDIAAFNKL